MFCLSKYFEMATCTVQWKSLVELYIKPSISMSVSGSNKQLLAL